MRHQHLPKDAHNSFPILVKNATRGYEFTKEYQPELADLLWQIFLILMKPIMALRAKIYRFLPQSLSQYVQPSFPLLRTGIIIIGFSLVYFKNFSFAIQIGNPLTMIAEPSLFSSSSEDEKDYWVRTVNEYAPVSANELKTISTQNYIRFYKDLAISEMEAYGIPASITLAQALIESRAGNSRLARQNNNHFGIKCFSKKCRKGHCTNHFDDHHKDFFRKYESVGESYRAHSKLLQKERYKKLKSYGKDYKKWSKGLKEAGYATDKKYDKKLIGIIKKYKLYQYDS